MSDPIDPITHNYDTNGKCMNAGCGAIDPAVPDELRERIRSKSLSLVVSAYNSPQYGLATIAYETADELLDLFPQYAREERLDELRHIDDPVNVNLYFHGLISVEDRIAELTAKGGKDE